MSLTKEECKRALRELKMANNYPTSKYNDSRLIDFHLITFAQLIEEHFNNMDYAISLQNEIEKLKSNPPLKFEELKEGMWVWDDKFKDCMKIKIVFKPCKLYPNGSFKVYHDLNEEEVNFVEFEEGRFFPITKAMEYQK